MQQAIDEAGNIWEVDAQGNPVRYVGNANQQRGGGMQIKPADPTRQYDLQKAQADAAKASADAAVAGQMNQLQLAMAQADLAKAQTETAGAKLTPAARADAINGYQYANQLDQIVRQLEGQYKTGPGSTSGIGGIQDYLPLQANRQFDSTADAARGIVGQALGFTGGQLNSIQEAEASVGPYLPKSGDRDAVILDKIARLRSLANTARQRSVAILGGVPDVNGQITPVQPGQLPTTNITDPMQGATVLPDARGALGDTVNPSDGAGVTAAGNGLRREPRLAGIGQELLKRVQAGQSFAEVSAYGDKRFKEAGWPGISPGQRRALEYAVRYRAANPSKPVTNAVTGWENYELVPDASGPSTMGAIATSEVGGVPVGNTLLHFTNAASAGIPTYLAGDRGADVMSASRQTMPGSSAVGDIAGSIAAMVGIGKAGNALKLAGGRVAPLIGDALTGSGGVGGDIAYNATRGGFENGPIGAATGATAGLLGNKIGSGVVNTVGRGVRGVSDQAVDYLSSLGVPLTPGSLLGNRGITGRIVNKLESVPLIGDALMARRADGMQGFARAAYNEAGAPIGYSPTGTGYDAVEGGLKAAGQAIDNATAGVNIPLDDQFQRELADAVARGEALPPDFAQKFALVQRNRIDPGIQSGTLSGKDYAEMTRGIKGYRAEHQKAGFEGDYRDALGGIQSALDGAVARGAGPQVLDDLAKGRTAYRDFKLLQDATKKAEGGSQSGTPQIFTPAQLQASVRSSKFAQSGTNAPFYDLTKAGQDVLPSTVANSGSVDRGLTSLILPTVLGGSSAAAAFVDPKVAAPLAALSLLSTKGGAKLAQKALTGRSTAAKALGTKIIQQRRKAGLFGAALAGAVVPQLSQ